jgi:hypothetical protein
MESNKNDGSSTDPRLPDHIPAVPVDQKEADKKLDEYDKTLADSFPASDPPTNP